MAVSMYIQLQICTVVNQVNNTNDNNNNLSIYEASCIRVFKTAQMCFKVKILFRENDQ